ncbi:MAG: hypothetical protein APG08_01046 [Candidatus Methanofastidiosum methylothiophilum]|uniref:Uncharacterized protein n=1 Tax=Candidatus Methanofastidiosum methylothiophilum TaxID=1705564 RepID=A0A150JB52_9EURY|nr:MAG: hypothetical protein AN188_01067 [Candidatus Methanofastidiosum methylthiophilus]OQC51133.1 MAG: hypothetical protein BWX56_01110 [Euryarchaeota archaeon ADurb.Bin023]HNV94553.1 hypothetical protein [Methanofastidiosum sp.]KYC56295.1 MAG: hypothetical protein APG08_01046 [Candidatus Methanofastidiosum methylthiophilus]KYC58137.1 MAG: hypothetical protein APG09_00641 [Candidatus Methanofastidiosum methylthiophilus]
MHILLGRTLYSMFYITSLRTKDSFEGADAVYTKRLSCAALGKVLVKYLNCFYIQIKR